MYRVRLDAEGWLDLRALNDSAAAADTASSTSIHLTIAFAGDARLVALDHGVGGEFLVTLRPVADSLRATAWGTADSPAALAEQLSRPLLVRGTANGMFSELVFAPGVGAMTRLLARSLLGQLSVVRPDPGAAIESLRAWEVTEAGADGWRRVRYERDSAAPGRNLALRRTVVRFLGRDSAGERTLAAALARVEVSGMQLVSVSLPRWRVDSVTGETATRTFVLGRQIGSSVARVSISRTRTVALDAAESRAVDSALAALRREGVRVGLYVPPSDAGVDSASPRRDDSATGRRRHTSNQRTLP